MTASASKGPLIVFGSRAPIGSGGSENPDLAPSVFWGGTAMADPRVGYNTTRAGAIGIDTNNAVIKQVPSALSAVNIAAAQAPTAGTAINLVVASGAGITVVAAPTLVAPGGYAGGTRIPAGALAIDGLPGLVGFQPPQPARSGNPEVALYDPTTMLARNVRVTSVGNDTGAQFLVSGADVYGYPQTELITGANAGIASGRKAFKFITSVVPQGALSGSNVSVGTGDVFGLPLRADFQGEVDISWANTFLNAPASFVAADPTSPATSTTGDVRGTVTLPSASNGTNALVLYCMSSVSNLGSLFGVTPA